MLVCPGPPLISISLFTDRPAARSPFVSLLASLPVEVARSQLALPNSFPSSRAPWFCGGELASHLRQSGFSGYRWPGAGVDVHNNRLRNYSIKEGFTQVNHSRANCGTREHVGCVCPPHTSLLTQMFIIPPSLQFHHSCLIFFKVDERGGV